MERSKKLKQMAGLLLVFFFRVYDDSFPYKCYCLQKFKKTPIVSSIIL